MLQIRNLSIMHKKDLHVILQDFSCVWNPGDKAVIIGEEGNGKSTLLKWIYAPEEIEIYTEASGERITNRERLAYLPQELGIRDRQKTIYEFFEEAPIFFDQTPKDLGRLAKEFHVLPEFFYGDQRMETLSGGEKVKAQLMRLLMAQPTALLLDEPSNDLDMETLKWLEDFIINWPGIVLFISHDETLIERTANMVIHIEQIKRKSVSRYTVAHMPYLQYRQERADRFEKQEQQALSERREKKLREERWRQIFQRVEHEQNAISRQNPAGGRLLKKKMHTVKAMERRFERQDADMTERPEEESAIFFKLGGKDSAIPAGKTVIEYSLDELRIPDHTHDTSCKISTDALDPSGKTPADTLDPSGKTPADALDPSGKTPADAFCASDQTRVLANDIFLQIRGPEKICIVGRNGAGKTTLLRKIAEELLARTDIHAEYMPQNYEDLLPPTMTPVDYLDTSGEKEERTRIRTFLGALKYTANEMEHPIAELSGGQKAKVLLLKMSMSGANVLILDEPTRNFSPLSGPVIRQMLSEFPGAIISISHDRKYISEVCDKVYRLTELGLKQEQE